MSPRSGPLQYQYTSVALLVEGASSALVLGPGSVITGFSDGREYHFPSSSGNIAAFSTHESHNTSSG